MLKVWGRNNSSNVQKVLWACAEMGVPFERIDAGGPFGLLDGTEYRKLNPNSRVPTIDEDGFILWESNAIVRYLAAKHGAGTLWPTDLRQRADADRWMDWAATMLLPAVTPLYLAFIRTKPDDRDPAAIARQMAEAERWLRILDDQVAQRPYVGGDTLTMGDMPIGIHLFRWFSYETERPSLPNVEAYYRRLTERSAFREHCMVL